jgi:CarD family transcriptional regulator
MFAINQKVVYPSQGVGSISAIQDKDFKGETLQYYVIYLEDNDMTVMVPVVRAEELGIRPIVSAEEAEEALKNLASNGETIPSDWKLRYQMNLDLLKKGTAKDIASIVRVLYTRSKVKELPILEKKLYDSALRLLEDEIGYALGKNHGDVEGIIFAQLES